MPLRNIGKNVPIKDFQDDSLTGVAPVLFFEFGATTATSCPLITRVIIGQSEVQVSTFSSANPEIPLPQSSGSSLAGDANIVQLGADGTVIGHKPRFLFVSQTDNSVDPPVATEVSLAHNSDGLPGAVEHAYVTGLKTCFLKVTEEAVRLSILATKLEKTLDDFRNGI
jgi:hypothetical protein